MRASLTGHRAPRPRRPSDETILATPIAELEGLGACPHTLSHMVDAGYIYVSDLQYVTEQELLNTWSGRTVSRADIHSVARALRRLFNGERPRPPANYKGDP